MENCGTVAEKKRRYGRGSDVRLLDWVILAEFLLGCLEEGKYLRRYLVGCLMTSMV